MNKEKTGILIKEARVRKKYTQSELGDLLGVSNKAVSRWENGESFPDIGVLENLSNILEIKIQDLVVGEVQSNNDIAMNELVRLARLQAKSRTKEIYNCADKKGPYSLGSMPSILTLFPAIKIHKLIIKAIHPNENAEIMQKQLSIVFFFGIKSPLCFI